MLGKKDKDWIRDTIKEVVVEALTVEWTIEKVRDDKTGQPLAVPEKITEEVFIPSVFLQLLPFYEASNRGLQEDINKTNNKINDMEEKISAVGNIMLQTENSLKCLAALSDRIRIEDKVDLIEGDYESDS